MSERKPQFDYVNYQLGPDEVRCIIQYPRRANVRTISRRLSKMGITVDKTYEAVIIDQSRPTVVVRGIGSLEVIRAIQESGSGIKFFGEGIIRPCLVS